MPLLLLLLGLGGVVWGGRLAFNVRGAAEASAERARVNTELMAAAKNILDPPRSMWTVRRFRVQGARVFLAGLALLVAAFFEVWL
ncbi:hypothetical protein [Streptomyces justiciae]|uniref:Uncharacterized protein n=1 Tax=Streptomyces justiciae TaxID=2780140 RepID=A0ABU3M561_9ACTN|nr:hypothetical protein [Streptomyces justiciae]MDT7846635.1 hypothetical protein [Streptomyces justiciae]